MTYTVTYVITKSYRYSRQHKIGLLFTHKVEYKQNSVINRYWTQILLVLLEALEKKTTMNEKKQEKSKKKPKEYGKKSACKERQSSCKLVFHNC